MPKKKIVVIEPVPDKREAIIHSLTRVLGEEYEILCDETSATSLLKADNKLIAKGEKAKAKIEPLIAAWVISDHTSNAGELLDAAKSIPRPRMMQQYVPSIYFLTDSVEGIQLASKKGITLNYSHNDPDRLAGAIKTNLENPVRMPKIPEARRQRRPKGNDDTQRYL